MKYRPEIDGLRAIAVASVIIFHAGFATISGGFLGVDVFFVISGYLITTLIINDIQIGKFSFLDFYERRSRRILPALFFVILVSLPFAWALLLPQDMTDFALSVISVGTFSSNFLFWFQSGYFDRVAELKPLLHTWSLAVEEQYYILTPIFFVLSWRIGVKKIVAILVFVSLISIGTAHWAVAVQQVSTKVSSAAFFLLPARAFELLAGSLTAFYLLQRKPVANSTYAEASGMVGLLMILIPMFAYDAKTPLPGMYSLVPIIGTALVICFAVPGTVTQKILSARFMVAIGLMSYSAYLWHHPIFAFRRYWMERPATTLVSVMMVMSAFGMAYLSWRFIERPFRNRRTINTRVLVLVLVSVFVILGVFSTLAVVKKSNLWRYEEVAIDVFNQEEAHNTYVWERINRLKLKGFADIPNAKRILVIGDSQGGDLINALIESKATTEESLSSHVIDYYCGNLAVDVNLFAKDIDGKYLAHCKSIDWYTNPTLKERIREADIVFVASSWQEWQLPHIKASADALQRDYGDKFYFLGHKGVNLDLKVLAKLPVADRQDAFSTRNEYGKKVNEVLRSSVKRYIDPYELACPADKCPAFTRDGELIWYEWQHFTKAGARLFGVQLQQRIRLN